MSDPVSPERFWDDLYGRPDRIRPSRPNAALTRETADLDAGTALDLGCAEGADAIDLARRGWRVTGVDVSRVALDRAAREAALAGVTDRIEWQQHDLAVSFPDGEFDLVSAQFLHSYLELPREAILRRAAAAVAPGGILLVVGHRGPPSWAVEHEGHHGLPTSTEVLAGLALPPERWTVLRDEEVEQAVTAPDGRLGTRLDAVLSLRRSASDDEAGRAR